MSKNLTQLTYDISSFYNISADTAAEKLQSALSGQVMPMRQLGFAIEETTLKQVALNHGIEASVENMTQAQKAQLRYVAIMEQAGNIGVLGDMARTIDTAANGMRVLQARLQQFARAIGNMVMPVLSAVLPYATAFVQVLTEGAQKIANFFGFELPKIDFSGAAVSSGFDDITSSVDAATEANEKFKGSLSSIDQLNIIGSKDEGKGSGGNENQFDLGIKLPEYDFLQGIESKTKEIVDDIKAIMPWVEALGIGLLYLKIGKSPVFTQLTELAQKATPIGKVANSVKGIVGGLLAGGTSGILLHGGFKNLISGEGKLGVNIAEVVAGSVIGGVALKKFYSAGNKWGAALTAGLASYGIASGILDGWAKRVGEAGKKAFESEIYNNGGTKISEIASAFEDWASAATNVNKQTIEKYSQLEQYDDQMSGLRDTIKEIAGVDLKFDEITPANAEKLKEPFDTLCSYLKTDFENTVKTVADDVAQVFKNLNLSGSINAEMQASFKSMQRMFDDTITDTQKVVDEYLDKMSQGYKLTDAEMKDFTQNFNFAFDLSAQKDEGLQNLERTINEIDLSKIDFEKDEYASEALDKIKASSEEYIQSAKDRLQAEFDNTAEMRRQLDVMKQYGKITDEDYKSQVGLLDLSENLFGLNYQNQISDVRAKLEEITGAVFTQLDNSARDAVSSGKSKAKWNEWLNSFLVGDLDNLDNLVKGRLLLDSDIYDKNFELSQFGTKLDANVEFHNTFADESTAQTWAIMLKEKQPYIDVSIGRLHDETGQLKYIVGDVPTLLDANIDAIKDLTGEWQYFIGDVQPELKAKMVELYDATGNLDYITGKKTAEIKLIVTQERNEANRISDILSAPMDILSGPTAGLIARLPSNLSNNLSLSQFANSLTNEDKLRMYFGDNLRGLEHDQMEEMGGYLMEGLAKGIFDNGAMVKEAIGAIAYSSIDELKAICGVASPSKVFKEIGGFLMQGLGLGIENNSGLVIGAQGSLFDSMMKQQEEFKKHCEKYDLSNFSSEDFIPDLSRSYKLPAGAAVIGGAVGAAREAYSNAAQSAVIANNGQTIDAHFTVQSYVELDGEQVGHAAAEYNQQQMAYSNGR